MSDEKSRQLNTNENDGEPYGAVVTDYKKQNEKSTTTYNKKQLRSSDKAKRNRKRSFEKPRDMPRRALTAYNIYFQEQRRVILRQREEKGSKNRTKFSQGTMARMISERWKKIKPEELARCKERAEADQQRYFKEMVEYHQVATRKYNNPERTSSHCSERNLRTGQTGSYVFPRPQDAPEKPEAIAGLLYNSVQSKNCFNFNEWSKISHQSANQGHFNQTLPTPSTETCTVKPSLLDQAKKDNFPATMSSRFGTSLQRPGFSISTGSSISWGGYQHTGTVTTLPAQTLQQRPLRMRTLDARSPAFIDHTTCFLSWTENIMYRFLGSCIPLSKARPMQNSAFGRLTAHRSPLVGNNILSPPLLEGKSTLEKIIGGIQRHETRPHTWMKQVSPS